MDVVKSFQFYLNKMVSEVSGMKVLLLDKETAGMVSLVFTQSQLLTKEVFLVDRIDLPENRDNMKHLKCLVFIRPGSKQNMQHLENEISNPHYGSYYLYFSNILQKESIERLAEFDHLEVVKEVNEYYGDFYSIHPDTFTLNISQCCIGSEWKDGCLDRSVEGIVACLLSLKKKPVIRFDRSSSAANKLAFQVHGSMQREASLFDFRRPDVPPLLLILDRKSDPITPLLTQWTYEAMVHDLLGIQNGLVSLAHVPDVRPELEDIVLNPEQDAFYQKNMYRNLGDLGVSIKDYVNEYQGKTKSSAQIESISDMKKFIEEYPEFRKMSGNVSKHVALVSELSRLVDKLSLLTVSELEQRLACTDSHNNDLKDLASLLENDRIDHEYKVRLVMLYALRYEKMVGHQLASLMETLKRQNVSDEKISWISKVLKYSGSEVRQVDSFSLESIISRGKSAIKGLKGVENIYTQHNPHLAQILEAVTKNKLKDSLFPYVDSYQILKDKPQDIIIFIVNGATFEEAKYISQLNTSIAGQRIVLGGTTIHSAKSFIEEINNSFG